VAQAGRERSGRAWTVAKRCPYLGLEDNREEVLLEASPRHRCRAGFRPDRVGIVHQRETCLTADYRQCLRLASSRAPGEGPAGRVTPPRVVVPPSPARRPLSLTEIVVLGLSAAIVLTCFAAGYVVVHRLQVGPGMEAAPLVAAGPETVVTETFSTPTPIPPTITPMPTATELVVVGLPPTPEPAPVSPTPTPEPVPVSPTPTPEPVPVSPTPTPDLRPPATSPPTRLVIPKISLDIPVVPVGTRTIKEGGKTKVVWGDVSNAGAFHESSAYPGHPGNTVINGHRDILGSVFRHLNRVDVGDEIILYVADVAYRYDVAETLVLPETFASAKQRAENLKYIGYIPEERLTLITCTPVGLATHRLLVIARPSEPIVPQMPEAGSDPSP
jgi:LPXTG-site transpeptidase (sortase) family protein